MWMLLLSDNIQENCSLPMLKHSHSFFPGSPICLFRSPSLFTLFHQFKQLTQLFAVLSVAFVPYFFPSFNSFIVFLYFLLRFFFVICRTPVNIYRMPWLRRPPGGYCSRGRMPSFQRGVCLVTTRSQPPRSPT